MKKVFKSLLSFFLLKKKVYINSSRNNLIQDDSILVHQQLMNQQVLQQINQQHIDINNNQVNNSMMNDSTINQIHQVNDSFSIQNQQNQ